MFASVPSAMLRGARGQAVQVEVHLGKGLPGLHIVGLPDESIREARDRARAALASSGFDWPNHLITISLAPCDGRKTGSGLDLAIAVGVLVVAGFIDVSRIEGLAFIGELGLDGSVRPIRGVVPIVAAIENSDVVVPASTLVEANIAARGQVHPVRTLRELLATLCDGEPWPDHEPRGPDIAPVHVPDLCEVQGQPLARLALEIAAAGAHHSLFMGPPGSGKTMLASRLPGILPPLERAQALEATMVHSAAGAPLPPSGLIERPPFRAPHHTSSQVAIIGGGSQVARPGEVSLAHHGVLFLDEIAEFPASVLDSLRQPLEDGVVLPHRSQLRDPMPARFLLIAAMNPCPCGGGGGPGDCTCGDAALQRYTRRLSGPVLDRFDLRVNVHRPAIDEIMASEPGEPSSVVAARVLEARRKALDRQACLNRSIEPADLDRFAPLEPAARARLRHEMERGRLSGRGYHRVRRVARTIADLREGCSAAISEADAALALELRASLSRAQQGRAA